MVSQLVTDADPLFGIVYTVPLIRHSTVSFAVVYTANAVVTFMAFLTVAVTFEVPFMLACALQL